MLPCGSSSIISNWVHFRRKDNVVKQEILANIDLVKSVLPLGTPSGRNQSTQSESSVSSEEDLTLYHRSQATQCEPMHVSTVAGGPHQTQDTDPELSKLTHTPFDSDQPSPPPVCNQSLLPVFRDLTFTPISMGCDHCRSADVNTLKSKVVGSVSSVGGRASCNGIYKVSTHACYRSEEKD